MSSSRLSIRGVPWRWLAAALAIAWIVAILPDLPVPYCDRVPRLFGGITWLGSTVVGIGGRLGSVLGSLAGLVWAMATGVVTSERHDMAFVPLASRAWLGDLRSWGMLLGTLAAAALPTWLLWVLGRLLSASPHRAPSHVLDLRRALRETLAWVRMHPGRYALLVVIGAIVWGIDAAVHDTGARTLSRLAWSIPVMLGIGTVTSVLQYGIGLSVTDGRPRTAHEAIGGIRRVVRFGVLRVVGATVTVAGLLLFLIPGLVWLMATQLAGIVVVAEDVGPVRALGRSVELTRGVRWKLSAAPAVLGVLVGLVGKLWGAGPIRGLGVLLGGFIVLFMLACYGQLVGTTGRESVAHGVPSEDDDGVPWWRRLVVDPALLVAAAWSLVLASVFATSVGAHLVGPQASLLMLPPLDGGTARAGAPLADWCPYSLHPRRRECETAIENATVTHAFGIDGYAFQGARCVPAPTETWPSWRAWLITRATDALAHALPAGTAVRRPYRIGADEVDLAVLGDDPAGAVVLALDVGEPSTDTAGDARAARLAAAGVPEYWRIEVHTDRDPVKGGEMLRRWSDPVAEQGAYGLATASSRNQDLLLHLAALPAVRVAIDDVLPDHPCPHPNSSRPEQEAHTRPSEVPAFVTDGSTPAPSLVFEDFDGAGVAHRLRFTAVSLSPADSFDPAATGLAVTLAGPFFGEQVMDVVLLAGDGWTRSRGDRPSWTYHDTTGRTAGITDVVVRTVDGGALAWEVSGTGGNWAVSWPVVHDWGRLDLGLREPSAPLEAARTAFFLTAGLRPHCVEDPPGTLTCRTPPPPESCSATEPNAVVRCTVEQLARAEDVFFASHGRYFSGACDDLPQIRLPPGLSCSVMGTPTTFVASARHPRMTLLTGCVWESSASSSPIRCS